MNLTDPVHCRKRRMQTTAGDCERDFCDATALEIPGPCCRCALGRKRRRLLFADVAHLDALTIYRQWMESRTDRDGEKLETEA